MPARGSTLLIRLGVSRERGSSKECRFGSGATALAYAGSFPLEHRLFDTSQGRVAPESRDL